jgi:hypothetical protein
MAQAMSISLTKFTATVQAAVKAAVQKHPKFRIEPPTQVAISYLIRGIPVPESMVANATLAETQAFAAEIASQIASSGPQVAALQPGTTPEGAVYSRGNHVIIGIPAATEILLEK